MRSSTREKSETKKLRYIDPDDISRNPENPRLFFRQEELDQLLLSINEHGIQVPLTVYEDKGQYFLLDGERRWICARKLNYDKVPALVQSKPNELENLLLMYNIHALREQWDYYTIARSLERVISLFKRDNKRDATDIELAAATGLSLPQIRRCKLLIEIPTKYKDMLSEELKLPKSRQRFSEDTLIEMERSLKAVIKRFPVYRKTINRVRDSLLIKVRRNEILAVTDFRQLSKIATSTEKFGLPKARVARVLDKVFDANSIFGIREAYDSVVKNKIDAGNAARQARSLLDYLEDFKTAEELQDDVRQPLRELQAELRRLFGVRR